MSLIVDENIAYAQQAFSDFGNVKFVDGRSLTNSDVKDADILIIRSVTKVDEQLLQNSRIKFVGTATIGTDHVDLKYLKKNNIFFADAKGCNADSVAEYVFTALLEIASGKNISLREKTIGVVGIGNIGSRVVRLAESLGMKVLKNDPPLERQGIGKNYVSLNEILKADIITLHVPLTFDSIDKTFHLLNEKKLEQIKKDAIIINTSRGAVIDNSALLNETKKKDFSLVLDVWENEPSISIGLLEQTEVATPHIAGYSLEGKVNGTKLIYDSLCNFLKIKSSWQPEFPVIKNNQLKLKNADTDEKKLCELFSSCYDIESDSLRLKEITKFNHNEQARYFDFLRKSYPMRREFSNFLVTLTENEEHLKSVLESFRFKVRLD
jgi:erythronate-4-phosphate dehydrogenase